MDSIKRSWNAAATVVLVAMGYFAIAYFTLTSLFLVTADIVPVWPAAGWAVASVLRWKTRGLVGVILGVWCLQWAIDGPMPWTFVVAGVALESVVAARLLERLGDSRRVWFGRARDIPLLAGVAALCSSLSATIRLVGACVSGSVGWSEFTTQWLVYWLGDSLGILFVAPVLLGLFESGPRMNWRRLVEFAIVILTTGTLSLAVFEGSLGLPESALVGYAPLLLWASLRLGTMGASAASWTLCGFALWGAARGSGPFADGNLVQQMALIWTFSGVVLIGTLLFAAILEERRQNEKRISERESLIGSFYDGSPVMMGIIEVRFDDLMFVSCNAALASFFAMTPDQVRGRTAKGLGRDARYVDLWLDKCRDCSEQNRPIRFEYCRVNEHGKQTMAATVSPIDGAPSPRYSFVLEDVTERAVAQQQLDRFVSVCPDMLCVIGVDGFLTRANPAFTETLGVSSDQLRSRPFVEHVHPADRETTLREVARLERGVKTINFENRHRRADGEYRWFSWTAIAELDEGLIYAAARDVTEAKAAAELLHVAKERAEAATQAKSEFVANVSHELRTPLSAIIGLTELIQPTLRSAQREYADGIRQSADALLLLVNDLLDFAKIESGKIEIETTPFSLEKVVASSIKPLIYQAHHKGIELVYTIEAGIPDDLMGDPTRLQQVLVNIVSNAVKFTETGDVSIDVSASGEVAHGALEICVCVRDTGIGIPEERQLDIFESFVQADGTTTRKHGGTGLGLAICSRLVPLMGGRIWVESEPGRGSAFHFTARLKHAVGSDSNGDNVPSTTAGHVLLVDPSLAVRESLASVLTAHGMTVVLASDGAEALRAIKTSQLRGNPFQFAFLCYSCVVDDATALETFRAEAPSTRYVLLTRTTDRLPEDYRAALSVEGRLVKPVAPSHLLRALTVIHVMGETPAKESLTDTFAKRSRSQLRILVVDDDPMNRTVTSKLLTKVGHDVTLSTNGREAFERTKENAFDMIFMDLQMPEMDGLEAATLIRARESALRERRTPIVALTANARAEDRDRCLAGGMDGYLVKPVKPQRLLAAAERFGNVEAPPRSNHAKVIDVSELDMLVQGDGEVLSRVLEVLLDETLEVVADIRVAVRGGDWNGVQRSAHRLRGSLLAVGARSPATKASRIENAARAGRRQEVEREWYRLEAELPLMTNELESIREHASVG